MSTDIACSAGQDGATLVHATIMAATDAGLIIHGRRGVSTAKVAAGCLIEPGLGDRVLVSQDGRESYVLAVLSQATPGSTIRVDGELSICADNLHLRGRESNTLESARTVKLNGPRVAINSADTDIRSGRIHAVADEADCHIRSTRLVGSSLEVFSQRVTQCARQVVRRVSQIETLHVGSLVHRIRNTFMSRSKRATVTCEKDVHIDGERIHMG